MEQRGTKIREHGSASRNFKVAMVALLFSLSLARLILYYFFPSAEIFSVKVLLFITLIIVSYLWVQEVKDYYYLLRVNRHLREIHEQLEQAEIDTIAALVKAEEEKDINTRGHSERVTEIALAIAREMGLSDEDQRCLSRASILHDIGKIAISDDILCKKGQLTEADWQVIKSHPENAVRILEPLKFLLAERYIILHHHERYDGKGYPTGRKGAQLSREAMILAVADGFDAMNSRRHYRALMTRDDILAELVRVRGEQYSPEAIDMLLQVLKKKPQLWERSPR